MKFAVPQFIEVEDKIFGPLTLKQAIYAAGGVGFAVLNFVMFGLFMAFLLGGPVLVLAIALAFVKVNNRPFVDTLESAFYYTVKRKLYLWKKSERVQKAGDGLPDTVAAKQLVPRMSESKLKDLAWSLDIKESTYTDNEGNGSR